MFNMFSFYVKWNAFIPVIVCTLFSNISFIYMLLRKKLKEKQFFNCIELYSKIL